MGRPANEELGQTQRPNELRLRLDGFAWEAVVEESDRLGVSVEELARFSVLYYLADLDSGRIARRIPDTPSLQPKRR